MDFFFCLPILFGCPTKIKQEHDGFTGVCPRCHNAQVVKAKSRTWFEVCFVPLIPMKSKHIYACGICQWQIDQGGSFQPQPAMGGGGQYQGGYPQQPMAPQGGGYPPKH